MKVAGTNWLVYLGIITEPTQRWNQREFRIYIPELSPFHEGDISPEHVNIPVSIKNVGTKTKECKDIKVTKTVKADYFGVETSRSVPTMVKGQQVLVINFANTSKYYWIPLERDDDLRTFERIRISCANVASINKSPIEDPNDMEARKARLTDDNTYFLEIDTRDKKRILISTSGSDGETWRYFFKMDPEERSVEIWDEHVDENDPDKQPPNRIKLESRPEPDIKGKITLQNASGTSLILEDKNCIFNVPANMVLNVEGELLTNVSGDSHTHIGGSSNVTIDEDSSVAIGNDSNVVIGNDSTVEIAGDRKLVVDGNNLQHTRGIFTELQKTRTSTTEEKATWNAKDWSSKIEKNLDIQSDTFKLTINSGSVTSKDIAHISQKASISYMVCPVTIIREGDPIVVKSIV